MGSTYRFIELPGTNSKVMEWFNSLSPNPIIIDKPDGALLYFRHFGNLVNDDEGEVNFKLSPIISIFLPTIRRGLLWTVGEVHFNTTTRKIPSMDKLSRQFRKWIKNAELIYPLNSDDVPTYDYYLEGSIGNFDPPIYAFPSGLEAIQNGQYFVDQCDNEFVIDRILKTLKLRGISS